MCRTEVYDPADDLFLSIIDEFQPVKHEFVSKDKIRISGSLSRFYLDGKLQQWMENQGIK